MKILVWSAPWAAHGDPLFFQNCLGKHLLPQANLLASAGCDVDLVLPEFLKSQRSLVAPQVRVIDISVVTQMEVVGHLGDPSEELYSRPDGVLAGKLASGFAKILAPSYDVILLWETPVPFLEALFPDALIVNQMPGVFSRPPYPHTVTFDPVGLYRQSTLYRWAEQIQHTPADSVNTELAVNFSSLVRTSINSIQPFDRNMLDPMGEFKKLVLLPLQVSAHYSFQADTKYKNQTDFLLDVLSRTDPSVGVVVTQYVTPRVQDTVLTKDIVATLRDRWPNLIYREEFDRITSVSQYLLPLVDQVIACSSSIGLQAMAWSRSLSVPQNTFLAPYASGPLNVGTTSERERFLNTLAFLIGRNQPLASAVTKNKVFLLGLLEEMLKRKRESKIGIDLLPSFHEIDPEYSKKLLESFTTDRAARSLQVSSERWAPRQSELSKFARVVNAMETSVITFDVFDTLIKRPTETPADAYKFLERRALEITHGVAEDFSRVRLNAEIETREKSTKGEISLDDIYNSIKYYYELSDTLIESLKSAEIEMELRLVQPRPFGRSLWLLAVDSGKPIYLISDMYLDHDVIERMLQKSGYAGYKKLFLSSDYGVRKKEGGLFDIVLGELKTDPAGVLHVGDNKVADVEQAQARGMRTFRLLRAVDRMRGSEFYKNIYSPKLGAGERARSAIAGLTAHALFDSPAGDHEKLTHFHGNPYNLGYAALGPLVAGFMLWLGRQAKRDGITRLYFLSREGWLLKQVYDALNGSDDGAVPSVYLYASRRATRVASLQGKGDVLALAGQPFKAGVSVGELLTSRFGIPSSDVSTEMWLAAGYSGPDEKLKSDSLGRIKFAGLCGRLSEQILVSAADERQGYLAYLAQSGLGVDISPAVVDIGWRANMQGALGDLISRPLAGYYYATLQGAEVWKAKGHHIWAYVGDMLAMNHPSEAVKNRHFLEYLTCHIEPSLLRIEYKDKALIPVFRTEESIGMRRLLIEEIHLGAVQFAKDLRAEFSHVMDQIWIDSFLGDRVFSSFVNQPSKIDAEMFIGHYFEDALGGISRQYIIKPTEKGGHADSVWKAGSMAVYPQGKPVRAEPMKQEEKETPSIVSSLEARLIRAFWTDKQYAKYENDRDAFFRDSKISLARAWYRQFG